MAAGDAPKLQPSSSLLSLSSACLFDTSFQSVFVSSDLAIASCKDEETMPEREKERRRQVGVKIL
eukprot:2929105-Rhodomonas_salina.1